MEALTNHLPEREWQRGKILSRESVRGLGLQGRNQEAKNKHHVKKISSAVGEVEWGASDQRRART